ncbi:hypothetical protein ES705_44477 [subsurface metagenome]
MTYEDGTKAMLVDFMKPRPVVEDFVLVVVGSRESRWKAPDPVTAKLMLFNFMDESLSGGVTAIMSGESDEGGVDIWIHEYADERFIEFIPRPPDFEKFGRPNAYYQRNQQMADEGDHVWAFLAIGASLQRSGSMQTVRMARRQRKRTRVYRITPKGVVEVEERR